MVIRALLAAFFLPDLLLFWLRVVWNPEPRVDRREFTKTLRVYLLQRPIHGSNPATSSRSMMAVAAFVRIRFRIIGSGLAFGTE